MKYSSNYFSYDFEEHLLEYYNKNKDSVEDQEFLKDLVEWGDNGYRSKDTLFFKKYFTSKEIPLVSGYSSDSVVTDIEESPIDPELRQLFKKIDALEETPSVKPSSDGRFSDFKSLLVAKEKTLRFYVGDYFPTLLHLVERLPLLPYQTGWYRKGMRSFKAKDHEDNLKSIIAFLTLLNFSKLDIIQKLRKELPEKHLYSVYSVSYSSSRPFSHYLAYLIDSGDSKVIETVEEIITSENVTSVLTYEIISAVLCSKNKHLNDLLLKLLLAAQRQEGLRQTILEQVDQGRIGNLYPYLELIKEENLIRFSSVKRAVGTWTGVFSEEDADRMTGKEIDYLLEGYSKSQSLEAMISSSDNLQLLIGLNILGNYNLDLSIKQANYLLQAKQLHTRIAAAYFINDFTDISPLEASKMILNNRDSLAICAILIRKAIPNVYYLRQQLQAPFELPPQLSKKECPNALQNKSYDPEGIDLFDYVPSVEAGEELFNYFESILAESNEETIRVENTPFKGIDRSVERGTFAEAILLLSLMLHRENATVGNALLDRAIQYLHRVTTYARDDYFYMTHYPIRTEAVRQSLLEGVKDRVVEVKEVAITLLRFGDIELNDKDLEFLAECYKYKAAALRTGLTNLFLERPKEQLLPILEKLFSDRKQDVRLGGLDILLALRAKPKKHDLYQEALPYLDNIKKPSAKEEVLINQCRTKLSAADMPGFGLYDPDLPLTQLPIPEKYDIPMYKDIQFEEIKRLVHALGAIIKENADLEMKEMYGDKVTLGTVRYNILDTSDRPDYSSDYEGYEAWNNKPVLERIFFPELWKKYIEEEIKDKRYLDVLFLFMGMFETSRHPNEEILSMLGEDSDCEEDSKGGEEEKLFNTMEFERKLMGFNTPEFSWVAFEREPYAEQIRTVVRSLDDIVKEKDSKEYPLFVQRITNLAIHLIQDFAPEELCGGKRMWNDSIEFKTVDELSSVVKLIITQLASFFTPASKDSDIDREQYKRSFTLLWTLQQHLQQAKEEVEGDVESDIDCNITIGALLFALEEEMITKNDFYKFIIESDNSHVLFEALSWHAGRSKLPEWRTRSYLSSYTNKELAESLYQPYLNIILESELTRGDSPTKLSNLAVRIPEVVGTDTFARIVTALGTEKLNRSSYYSWGWYNSTPSKKDSLSTLMRNSRPAEGEDETTLTQAFETYKIDPKPSRLTEFALYAKGWQEILEKVSGIKGLVNGALFFRAHNSEVSEQYEAEIARLTPVPIDDLREGAFDVNWFRHVYEELGDENLDILYDAAKYITDGVSHTRARKFVDASLGRFDIDELEETILDKRNKDLVLAYPLLPMPFDKKGNRKLGFTKELVRRYTFLQTFLKSSKQFGAQRQASEAQVVKVSMRNLATSAGYADVTRMSWQVESDLFKEIEHLFTTHTVDDYEITLSIDELGACDLQAKNNKGKPLKSIPSKVKKDERVAELIKAKKTAEEQWRRSRASLELAMENEDIFNVEELCSISHHPVLRPLLNHLVIGLVEDGDEKKGYTLKGAGFFDAERKRLTGIDDIELTETSELLVAHPAHLQQLGCWSAWQKLLFERELKQPFKQVFRELYVPTADELEKEDSRRYAGHQIQPKVAVGVLKKRLWVVDPEEGLQKIDYKRGVISTIYAIADWFSPSDIEPPTIEWVVFHDRKSGRNVKIDEIPPVMFSETMRDVDLVVSVAHAGNVDPLASHSTVEMRRALVELSMPLFKMKNVTLTDNHAIIKGGRAEYTVHLGSGVVHQKGGAQIAVLAVQSQTRGRIFLPFVDDDPKTAEILSKILMFSEDKKIKDPSILDQISDTK